MQPKSSQMPALFIGHGSPMLAIEDNPFTPNWKQLAKTLPKPKAILCISAHWVADRVMVNAQPDPELIFDFYGFPKELYNLSYPVAGSPMLAQRLQDILGDQVTLDYQRGFDHGAWIVAKAMYPEADIPMIQLSLDANLSFEQHIELAQRLAVLRQEGILILGSGNLIHNLRAIDWAHFDVPNYGFDWAKTAQHRLLEWIKSEDWQALLEYSQQGDDIKLAIPTPEHYLPLLYILALKSPTDQLDIFNQQFVGGSLDMTCLTLSQRAAAAAA